MNAFLPSFLGMVKALARTFFLLATLGGISVRAQSVVVMHTDLPADQAAFMAASQVFNFADNFSATITTAAWRTKRSRKETALSSFPKLPHVEAGTNLVVLNALEAVVQNNVERVFDFIVAEDVVVLFRKSSPAIVAVEEQTGTWNHPGASRIIVMDNGNRFRESIIAYQRPYLFHYMLTEFSGAQQKGIVNEAIAMFMMQPYGPRTHVSWHYAMRPESDARLADARAFMQNVWRPWQQGFMDALKKALDKDPWST